MNKKFFTSVICTSAAVLSLSLFNQAALASDQWQPKGPIKLLIGFKAGGGSDTQARLIAEELEARKGWKIIPEQVTGKGGLNLAKTLTKSANDGTVIGLVVTETLGYNLKAARKAGMSLADFTPLTTTAGFQMGIIAKPEKGWATMHDVIKAAKQGEKIRFGSFSPRMSDLAYLVGKANGVDFNIVSVKGGKAVLNGINAGDLDIGWASGVQNKAVLAGELVNLASAINEPLKISPDAPLLKDLGVAFDARGYFMFIAPEGIPENARTAISNAIEEIVTDKETKVGKMIERAFLGATVIKGNELDKVMAADAANAEKLLKAASE